MKKRPIINLIIISLLLLTLCGCASLIEGEYTSSKPHESSDVEADQTSQLTLEVSDDGSIADALIEFIENGITYGKLKFTYEGDIEAALSAACIDVPAKTPVGSYAAAYIGYTLNKIVSYYEADISITYNHTQEELASVKHFGTAESVSNELLSTMDEHLPDLIFTCMDKSVTEEFVTKTIEELYYEHPDRITYLPEAAVTTYPKDSYPCIIEVLFSYNYTKVSTLARKASIEENLQLLIDGAGEKRGDEAVSYFADTLRSEVTFDYERESEDDYSRWYNIYTAYGALVMKRAAGEGYAMAMKMLCDRYDIECYVVRGRLNNVSHSWNIVKLSSGDYYHVDCSVSDDDATFYTDAEMSASYWWDSTAVPQCTGESLLPVRESEEPEDSEEEPSVPTADVPPLPDEGIITDLPTIDIDPEIPEVPEIPSVPPEEQEDPDAPTSEDEEERERDGEEVIGNSE